MSNSFTNQSHSVVHNQVGEQHHYGPTYHGPVRIVNARSTQPPWTSGNVHWMVPHAVNSLFTGRRDILSRVKRTLRAKLAHKDRTARETCQIVITGMGGQGKSELCLQIANNLRQEFWSVFWIDVSTKDKALAGYLRLARQVGQSAQTLDEARLVLDNIVHPWLVILDNADDPNVDYQAYLPSGRQGCVLLTSRLEECGRYATTRHEKLEHLDDESARELLFKSAQIPLHRRAEQETDARKVCALLGSHTLAIIQAGSYVTYQNTTLARYPAVYARQRQQLLLHHSKQAQSRYGNVYATFEASAETLQSSPNQDARDALELLSLLSMLAFTTLPLAIFKAAWRGSWRVISDTSEDLDLTKLCDWHVSHLISLARIEDPEWDSSRLSRAVRLLTSLSLIFCSTEDDQTSVYMHPLTHAWAKDRQDSEAQVHSWRAAGCVLAFSSGQSIWNTHQISLRPHLLALLDHQTRTMLENGPRMMVVRLLVSHGWLLDQLGANQRLVVLLEELLHELGLSSERPCQEWLYLYDLVAHSAISSGNIRAAVEVGKQTVNICRQGLAEDDPFRLHSEYRLALIYRKNGQLKKALVLHKHVVEVRKQTLAEDHPDLLASQHGLAMVYHVDGQVKRAVGLLKHVVEVRKQTLAEDHPNLLASQHGLASVYHADGQVKRAVELLEHVVQINKQTLAEDHPYLLASQRELASAYHADGQVKRAVELLKHVVEVQKQTLAEDHPDRISSEALLASFLKDLASSQQRRSSARPQRRRDEESQHNNHVQSAPTRWTFRLTQREKRPDGSSGSRRSR